MYTSYKRRIINTIRYIIKKKFLHTTSLLINLLVGVQVFQKIKLDVQGHKNYPIFVKKRNKLILHVIVIGEK